MKITKSTKHYILLTFTFLINVVSFFELFFATTWESYLPFGDFIYTITVGLFYDLIFLMPSFVSPDIIVLLFPLSLLYSIILYTKTEDDTLKKIAFYSMITASIVVIHFIIVQIFGLRIITTETFF